MSKLWEEKTEYTIFDPEKHDCCDCFDTFNHLSEFLPYKRNYGTLNEQELLCLIKVAKEHHWQALDLTLCGIITLPDELWELSDLKILYIGNSRYYSLYNYTLEDNTFPLIPKKIEQLKNLRVLSLSGKKTQNLKLTKPLICRI